MKHHTIRMTMFALVLCVPLALASQSGHNKKDNTMNAKEEFLNAVKKGDAAKVRELLLSDSSLAEAADTDGVSALLKGVYYGKKAVTDVLLAARRELSIFEAAATGRTALVAALIKKDAALANAFSVDGFYALGLAIFFKHPDTAQLLIDAGADVNAVARNAMKVRPLHAAAAARQSATARLLIEHGADVNARQEKDFAPLHEAAANGDLEFVRLLLDHGADVNAKTADGKTALTCAVESGQEAAAKLLRERGGI